MKYPTVFNSNNFSTDNSLYPFTNSSVFPRLKSNLTIYTNFDAEDYNIYKVSTVNNVVTVYLPLSPVDGSFIFFSNNDGSFSTNNFVINGNGNNINYSPSNFTNSNSQALLQAIFDFKSLNWFIIDMNKVGGGGSGVLNYNEMFIGDSSNVPVSSTKTQVSNLLSQNNFTYYVSKSGNDSNNGLSPNTPFLTVQHAIDVVTPLNDYYTIVIFPGNYTESVSISNFHTNLFALPGDSLLPAVWIDNITISNGRKFIFNGILVTNTFTQQNIRQSLIYFNNCYVTNYLNEAASTIYGFMYAYNSYFQQFNTTPATSSPKKFYNCNIGSITANNSNIYIYNSFTGNITITTGTLRIDNTLVSTNISPAISVGSGNLRLNSVKIMYINAPDTNQTINLANCTFRYVNSNFDYFNSTFSNVTFQEIGAQFDQIYIQNKPVQVKLTSNSINVNTTATSFNFYDVDTTSSVLTLTLPLNPIDGDVIYVSNLTGSFPTRNLTINGNSFKINNSLSNYICSSANTTYQFIYSSSKTNWTASQFSQNNPTGGGLSTSLASANLYVGNSSGVATATAITGDVTINNTGVTAIGSNKVSNSMLATMSQKTLKGNNTGATSNSLDLTVANVNEMLTLDNKTYYVSSTGSDSNSGLGIDVPFLTLNKACQVSNSSGNQIMILPGTYTETTTISNLNTSFTNISTDYSGIVNFTGTITISNTSSSVRFNGIRFGNLILNNTGSGGVYLTSCATITSLSIAGTGYVQTSYCEFTGPTNSATVSLTGANINFFTNFTKMGFLTVNNAASVTTLLDCLSAPINLISGFLTIVNSLVSSVASTSNAITSTGGFLTLNSTTCYNALSKARISITNTTLSYSNTTFDYTNSTFSGNTPNLSLSNFDSINVKGLPVDLKMIGNSTKTATFTVADFSCYTVDTTSGGFAITLPNTGIDGNRVLITCINNSFYTTPLTLSASPNKINGFNATYLCSKPFSTYMCIYNLTLTSWSVTCESQTNFNELIYSQGSSLIQSVPNNVETAITIYTNKIADPGVYWDATTSTFTTNVPGLFYIKCNLSFTNSNVGVRYCVLYKNSSSYNVLGSDYNPSSSNPSKFGGSCIVRLANGDNIQIKGYQNSGSALFTDNSQQFNQVQICRLGS